MILSPNVLDEFTHECLAIRVARKLKAIDVIDVLSDLFILRGIPAYIRSDNGFSRAFRRGPPAHLHSYCGVTAHGLGGAPRMCWQQAAGFGIGLEPPAGIGDD